MTKDALPPDLTVFVQWATGDRRAGDELFRRFTPVLQQFFRTKVRPEDIGDLIQQVWIALSETLRNRSEPGITTSVRAYIYGVARHLLYRHLRRKYRADSSNVDPLSSSIAALDPSLSTEIGKRLASQRMLLALQRLPIDTQTLLELRYVNELSTTELASVYGIPVGTVKSRLSHARHALELEIQRPVQKDSK